MLRRLFRCGPISFILVGMVSWSALAARADDMRFFRIGTTASDGVQFVVGTLIAGAISNPPGSRPCDRGGSCGVPGLIAVAQANGGVEENIELLRSKGLEAAIVLADDQLATEPGLAAVAALYPEQVHIVVGADSGITSAEALRGRRIAVGELGSMTAEGALRVLMALGLKEGDFEPAFLDMGTASQRLADGTVDALFLVGGAPLEGVSELASRFDIHLLSLPSAERLIPDRFCCLETVLVPGGTYADMGTVHTVAVPVLLLVRADLPETLVYDLAAALWHPSHRDLFDDAGTIGEAIRVDGALRKLPVPLHPGAQRYYRALGLSEGTAPPGKDVGQDAMVFPAETPPG